MNGPGRRRPAHARRAALAALCAWLLPAVAAAAPTCQFLTASALAFGTYDPLASAPLDSSSQLQYKCPGNQPLRISIDAGQSGTFSARELRSGSERLLYQVYLDAQRQIVWGDGTGGSSVGPLVTSAGTSGSTIAWLFARIFARQDAAVGAYADTLHVTLEL
jgi:spore coat protein U-like protein